MSSSALDRKQRLWGNEAVGKNFNKQPQSNLRPSRLHSQAATTQVLPKSHPRASTFEFWESF